MIRLCDFVMKRSRSLKSAPRDGTHILGPSACDEWQDDYWDPLAATTTIPAPPFAANS